MDMTNTAEGHNVNIVAILLGLIEKGILTPEEFIELQIDAQQAIQDYHDDEDEDNF